MVRKKKHVQTRVPPALHSKMKAYGEALGLSDSEAARDLLKIGLGQLVISEDGDQVTVSRKDEQDEDEQDEQDGQDGQLGGDTLLYVLVALNVVILLANVVTL